MKLCADVGGTFTRFAVVIDEGVLSDRHRRETPTDDWRAFVDMFRGAARDLAGPQRPEVSLAIALAGFVDPKTGVATSAGLPCVSGRPLARDLADAVGRPVIVTNDADCFALAEARLGVARGHRWVFGVILGTGVGGGLVVDGRLAPGEGGVAGEWGHGPAVTRSRTDPGATPWFQCGCGRWGCLNTVGAARGLERLHHYLHGLSAHSREITSAWEAGDGAAGETLDLYLELVSGALAVILNTVPATIVPVGGGLANCQRLVEELDARVRRGMLRNSPGPILTATRLGGDAGLLGAALAAEG